MDSIKVGDTSTANARAQKVKELVHEGRSTRIPLGRGRSGVGLHPWRAVQAIPPRTGADPSSTPTSTCGTALTRTTVHCRAVASATRCCARATPPPSRCGPSARSIQRYSSGRRATDVTKPEAEAALTAGDQEWRGRPRRDQVARGGRRPGASPHVCAGRRSERFDHDPLPGGPAFRRRGRVRHRFQAVRGRC